MKKILLTALACSALMSAYAQAPSLNSGNLVSVGDIRNYYVADTAGVTPGAAGANQTWDFTNVQMSSTKIEDEAVAPSTTPYASDFPNANVANQSAQGSWAYFRNTGTQIEMLGAVTSAQGVTVKQVYTDPLIQVKVPFTYNDQFHDDLTAQYVANGITVYRRGTHDIEADGWGSLMAPGGKTYPMCFAYMPLPFR